jgi:Na+/pantothenate symporter
MELIVIKDSKKLHVDITINRNENQLYNYNENYSLLNAIELYSGFLSYIILTPRISYGAIEIKPIVVVDIAKSRRD